MKVGTNFKTSHNIILNKDERFRITAIHDQRPTTIEVGRIHASQDSQNGPWHVWASGQRVLKSGKLGTVEKMDTFTYSRGFRDSAHAALFAEFSQEVQDKLHELGVTFDA